MSGHRSPAMWTRCSSQMTPTVMPLQHKVARSHRKRGDERGAKLLTDASVELQLCRCSTPAMCTRCSSQASPTALLLRYKTPNTTGMLPRKRGARLVPVARAQLQVAIDRSASMCPCCSGQATPTVLPSRPKTLDTAK